MKLLSKWWIVHKPTCMKAIVWLLLLNGVAWIWCSYILAFYGKEEIAETLSKTVVTEIIGVVTVYAVKALFENISKHNSWPDKPLVRSSEEKGPDKKV